jgi:hypothetical protein
MLYYVGFKRVNVAAVALLPAVLKRVLPGGRYESHRREYTVRNPTRADTTPGSFKIRVSGHRAGAWADFATGDRGGDPVSLIAYLENVSQREAALLLAQMLGLEAAEDRGHAA